MNYSESLDYLLSLGFERSVQKFGLENTHVLLDALGNPQTRFLKIQIAGTNGKGSTCAFLESICLSAGIKTGLNTSPHLVSVTERVRVNGAEITEEQFAEYATRVRNAGEKLVDGNVLPSLPTFFEHVTAMAQLVFADAGVEIAILEVGLGGRFDATTATMPEIIGITPIDLDHTKTLGGTIAEIAAEKAATIRKDTAVYTVLQNKEAKKVISAKCAAEGVTANVVEDPEPLDDGRIRIVTGTSVYEAKPGLAGRHQWTNSALAVNLAEELQKRGLEIDQTAIEQGLRNTRHAGRLEYTDGILFDGAHNVAGAKALREYLVESVDGPITMIFGSSSGKNLKEVGAHLFPLAEKLILTTSENPRAVDATEFLQIAERHNKSVHLVKDVGDAVDFGREVVGDGLIVVTGSLYLIGEVKAYLRDSEVQRRKAD